MKARAVCVPMGRPLVANSLLWVVMLIFSLAALLLTSCANSANPESTTPTAQAQTATQPHDYAYQYSDSTSADAPVSSVKRFANTDDYATAPISSVEEMRSLTNIPAQTYTVKAKQDTVIVGDKGIQVHIPSNCFDVKNPNTEVKFILKEYNSAADFFFANLTTGSNGQMLESGGTVYINAMSEGKLVNLKKGKRISLAFPTGKAKPGMQTFYGEKKSDGSINWQPAGESSATNATFNTNYYNRIFYPAVPKNKQIKYNNIKVKQTKMCQQLSTLTNKEYQIQALGSNGYCTRFTDSCEYKNVLEYFSDNFTFDSKDFYLLQNTFITYTYVADSKGKPGNIELKVNYSPKASLATCKAKKQAFNRLKLQAKTLIENMPKIEPTANMRIEIVKIYINDFSAFTNTPVINIKNEKVARQFYVNKPIADSASICIYEAWRDSVACAQSARNDSLMKNDADFYFVNSGKLGWINCDRFYNTDKPKGEIIVKGQAKPNLTVKVVFKNIMSVMQLYPNRNGDYQADNLPMGEAVRYIAVDKRRDGLYYAVKDATTSAEKVTGFVFKPMTMDAIKNELASL